MNDDEQLNWRFVRQSLPGWSVDYHSSLDSTNRFAASLGSSIEQPTLIVAEHQTAGRGRGGNRWWTASGGLTFSLVIDPREWSLTLPEQTLLSLLAAAVVRDVLCQLPAISSADVRLKWPNDVYLCGRKVSGILLEHSQGSGELLVIGVGLNVNNSWQAAPPELRATGVAVCDIAGERIQREQILVGLVTTFEKLLQDPVGRTQFRSNAWQSAHLLTDCLVTVQQGDSLLTGRCDGVDDDGALLLCDQYGLQRVLSAVVLAWEPMS